MEKWNQGFRYEVRATERRLEKFLAVPASVRSMLLTLITASIIEIVQDQVMGKGELVQ